MKNTFIEKMSKLQWDIERAKKQIEESLIGNLKETFKDIFERNAWINHIQWRQNIYTVGPCIYFNFYINDISEYGYYIHDYQEYVELDEEEENKRQKVFKELEETFGCIDAKFFEQQFGTYREIKIDRNLKIENKEINEYD
jgi:hypothetical protein